MRRLAKRTLLLLPIMAHGQSTPPQRPPTFQAGIEVIRLNLSVTDGRNRLITGLSDHDFAVFEDGIRQDLSLFTRDALPLSVSLSWSIARRPWTRSLPIAQEAGVALRQDPSGPRTLARSSSSTNGPRSCRTSPRTARPSRVPSGTRRASGSTVLYNALYVTVEAAAEPGESRCSATTCDRAALGRRRYGLPRQRRSGARAGAPGRCRRVRDRSAARPSADRQRMAFSQATYFLTTLSRDTGGEVYFPSSLAELDAVYGRSRRGAAQPIHRGYVSRNERRNGKWRRIVVRTPAREDLQVRHKLGYYAVRGDDGHGCRFASTRP